jgi:hypothetical protein
MMIEPSAAASVERWGIFELALHGPQEENPFLDVAFGARFQHEHRVVHADGFYDGEGVYRVRCMPDAIGAWRYTTLSNRAELDGISGEFTCAPPSPANHGPVVLRSKYHFAYADGTPYFPVGTTCYVWNHQGEELEERTLKTLAEAPFNKMRMCVFPKDYSYNKNEPPYYPFACTPSGAWDWTRLDPMHFRHLEQRVGDLMALGIEADLILFHPYDRWGFSTMDAETDDRYLNYVVARLAAYRNVWWSMANEYDLMASKTLADWDRFFRIVQARDPYQHPRSVHNCRGFYDHAKPWVTHQSIQRSDVEQTRVWRELYGKPVVIDECCYEGNIPQRWGDITAQEMVRRFWEGTARGGYVGHGETYLHPQDILWWSKGGVLHGQSPARIAFLRRILEQGPVEGLDPIDGVVPHGFPCAGQPGHYYLIYCGVHQPATMTLTVPQGGRYCVDILDTWEMTSTTLDELCAGSFTVQLPAKPYIAVRMVRAS